MNTIKELLQNLSAKTITSILKDSGLGDKVIKATFEKTTKSSKGGYSEYTYKCKFEDDCTGFLYIEHCHATDTLTADF